jgi:hypothetical protein
MKKHMALIAIAALCLSLSCATTPRHHYSAAVDTYTTAVDTISELYESGALTREDIQKINVYRLEADRLISAMKLYLQLDDSESFQRAREQFRILMVNIDMLVKGAQSDEN